ncbi:MAG: 1-acyl-sn-glycerol-3-phosphate acyltransferase [Clostridia bacterium]|nr:1-acyl-sn-glycerol-3-phosphate acyltransferase [Clostridia bacterium]
MSKKPEDQEFGYKLLTPFMRAAFRLYYNPRIIGAEKIPAEGSIVIAGNHKHVYDQCLTIMATKRMIHYMAKKEYFDGNLAPLFKFVGCIPVDRSRRDFSSAMSAMKVLKKDGAIGIFPEGTRNKTDAFLLRFKTGAVAMAKKSDAYIVPFGLTGDYKFRSKNLTVRYGEPFKVGDMTNEEANEKLYREVERLMLENLDEEKENRKHA